MRIFLIAMAVGCFTVIHTLPVPKSKTILIDADTVRFYASFIHSSARVNVDDLTIQFGAGNTREELLRVPLAAPKQLLPQAMIRITVGMNPPVTDNDPNVGISDGVNRNQYHLVDNAASTTSNVVPCRAYDGTYNGRSAPHGNIVAGTYVMVFDPIHNFGTCSTNNGFSTAGKFNAHVDPSEGLNLVVHRDNAVEEYTFHYFLVEFM